MSNVQQIMSGVAKIIGNYEVVIGDTSVYGTADLNRIYEGPGGNTNAPLTSNAIQFTLTQGQRGTAQLCLIIGPFDSYSPPVGAPVYIFSFGVRMYAGTVDDVKKNWIGEGGWNCLTVTCVSLEQQLDTLCCFPVRAYTNRTAGYIFADLFTAYYGAGLIKPGNIQPGPVVPTLTVNGDRLSDVLTQLATTAGFVWGVDQTTLSIYFVNQETFLAPFILQVTDLLWEESQWENNRADYRNRQITRMSLGQNLPSNCLFMGDGATKLFTFPYIPGSIVSLADTTSTQATCLCTFSGIPAPGDYVSVGTMLVANRYTFVSTLDNTQQGQVLIGASAQASAQNLADAINAVQTSAGIGFSLPTLEHPTLNAGPVQTTSPFVGFAFSTITKVPGTGGGLVQVTSSSAFSWGLAADGTDGTTGAAMTAGKDYVWPVVS